MNYAIKSKFRVPTWSAYQHGPCASMIKKCRSSVASNIPVTAWNLPT